MKFISYDLGTGGVKASLHDEKLNTLARSFIEYKTYYHKPGFHEQKPKNWWQGVIKSTKILLEQSRPERDRMYRPVRTQLYRRPDRQRTGSSHRFRPDLV